MIVPQKLINFGLWTVVQRWNPWANRPGFWGAFSKWILRQMVMGVTVVVCYPLHVIRNRLWMQADLPLDQCHYKGAWDCATRIVREEGLLGFYKGTDIYFALCDGILATLMIMGYDVVKRRLVGGRLASPGI